MGNTENLNPDEIDSDQNLNSSGKKEKKALSQMGSSEFYQGERAIEDVTLPGEKKSIKAETVKKEEIYQDKLEKHEAFIASLGRKQETTEKSDQEQPAYVEQKSMLGKKAIFSVFGICVLGAITFAGYWLWINKKQEAVLKEDRGHAIIPINQEPEQAVAETEQAVQKSEQPILADPAKLKVRVLNAGASAGSAGKIKALLVEKGYVKAEASNGELDIIGAFVYYSGQAADQDAKVVSKVLSDKGIEAKAKEALTFEQKSADIVVELGKK